MKRLLRFETKAEGLLESMPAFLRDRDGAAALDLFDPAQFEATAGQRHAQRAGEMRTAFAPVQAGTAEQTAGARRRRDRDAETPEKIPPGFGHGAAVLVEFDVTAREHRIRDTDAEPAGKVIVAGPRQPHRGVARPGAHHAVCLFFRP